MAHQVFICHSSRDKAVADAACAALEGQRISCWVAPRDVLAGMEYGSAIMEALSECQIVLLIFSQNANDSPQVRREIERAVSKEKIILPFRIQNVLPSNAMEYALGNTHWLDAMTPSMERHLSDLCQTVSRLSERQHPAEPLWRPESSVLEPLFNSDGKAAFKPIPEIRAAAEVSSEPVASSSPGAQVAAASTARVQPEAAAPPPRSAPVRVVGVSSPTPARRRAWMWTGAIAAIVVVAILVVVGQSSGPSSAAIQNVPVPAATVSNLAGRVMAPAEAAANPAGAARTRGMSVAEMEAEEQELYRQQNFGSAFPLAKGACDGGVAAACNHAGVMYARGRGTMQNESEAVALYQKACDGGEAGGCTNLAHMYQSGKGIGQDPAQALLFYRKGCDGNYAIGCTALGEIYEKGRGVPIDEAQAAAFYQKGCDEGNAIGCASLRSVHSGGREPLRPRFRR